MNQRHLRIASACEMFDLIWGSGGTWMGRTMEEHVEQIRSRLSSQERAIVSDHETLSFFRIGACRTGFNGLHDAVTVRCQRLARLRSLA